MSCNYRCPSCKTMIGFMYALLEPIWCASCEAEMAATLDPLPAACGNITVTIGPSVAAPPPNRAQRRKR